MKQISLLTVCALLFVFLAVTGFQCGSADITSAKLYMQHSDYAKAEASLLKEVTKNPGNTEAWYLLGEARRNQQNYKGMVEAYDNSLKSGKDFEDPIRRAKLNVWGTELNSGVSSYNRVSSASKDSAHILLQNAIDAYQMAITVNPDSTITYQNLALAYHFDGRYDDEISALKTAISHKPTADEYSTLINAYIKKGDVAEEKGMKQEATETYNGAIGVIAEARKFDPSNPDFLRTMIDLYVRTNRANEAKPFIKEAIAQEPSNELYQYNYGVLLMQTDSVKEAIPYFEAALKLHPNYELALRQLGVAHLKLGQGMKDAAQSKDVKTVTNKAYTAEFKKAAEYFKQLTEVKKDDPALWDALASAYANAEMFKEAKQAMEQADSLRKK
ncbi:MAG TPA: tetratricopeptide repeat protein [Bacteroidota bacterium]|nr:tetratricopeptide repeat protein [Bacteroidota bacterium]